MDPFMDKKWFVYLGNRHEGPFSVEELSGQMGTGKLSQQTYVWAEGMPDWQPMTTLSAFKNLRPEGREILAGNAKQGRSIRLPDGESSAGMREKETLQEELNHLHPSSD